MELVSTQGIRRPYSIVTHSMLTFFVYLFSTKEYRTLTCSSSALSSIPEAAGTLARASLATTLSCELVVDGMKRLSIRWRMAFWKETSGRNRSTGHCARAR